MLFNNLDLQQPQIMGILNVTPDSFSDGGSYCRVSDAVEQALRLVQEGATFIDVGGESTRPGASCVGSQEEMDRVLPVIEALRQASDVLISVDTSNPQLMLESARLGVDLINDVRSLTRRGALEAAIQTDLPVCIMHMRGEPSSMQQQAEYTEVVDEVKSWLMLRLQQCVDAGLPKDKILLDPGFGFAKHLQHNLELLAGLHEIVALGQPVLAGMSRKRMLGELTGKDVNHRDAAGIAAHLLAVQQGARILRVHSVAGLKDALKVWQAVADADKSLSGK